MSDDEDGPPMLVSSENVGDADEANLNAEMADAQIKKVPISIITGQFSFHSTECLLKSLLWRTLLYLLLLWHVYNVRLAFKPGALGATTA